MGEVPCDTVTLPDCNISLPVEMKKFKALFYDYTTYRISFRDYGDITKYGVGEKKTSELSAAIALQSELRQKLSLSEMNNYLEMVNHSSNRYYCALYRSQIQRIGDV